MLLSRGRWRRLAASTLVANLDARVGEGRPHGDRGRELPERVDRSRVCHQARASMALGSSRLLWLLAVTG